MMDLFSDQFPPTSHSTSTGSSQHRRPLSTGWTNDTRRGLSDTDLLPDDLDPPVKLLFIVLYLFIIVLALTGNLAVLVVVAAYRKMRTVTNTFVVSLAVSDTLIAGLNMPVQLAYYVRNEWTMGEPFCKFSKYLQGVVIVSSILTLTGIAVDRYYAICHPLKARHIHTAGRALRLVSLFWLTSCILVSPQLFIQRLEPLIVVQLDSVPPVRIAQSCAEYFPDYRLNVAYTLFTYGALYLLPVGVVMATYTCIVRKLRQRQRPEVARRHWPSPTSLPESIHERQRTLRDRKLIVRMLVAIVFLFAVSWFPFFTGQVYLLFDEGADRHHTTRTVMAVFQLIGYSNSCTNSIVYCFLSENFQKHLLQGASCCRLFVPDAVSRLPVKPSRGRWAGSVETVEARTEPIALSMRTEPIMLSIQIQFQLANRQPIAAL